MLISEGWIVPDAVVGDDPCHATHLHADREDISQCRRLHIVAGIDDQHVAGSDLLDGDALDIRLVVVFQALEIEVLTHRDVP